jgi:hypothetical protein
MKFCKVCGANLEAVRVALVNPEAMKKFDWGDTWLAEMFRSGQAAELRKIEMERQMGITPEVKRYIEIKAGVITSAVGVGVALFLFIFMQGVIGSVTPRAAEIISRLWIAGVIPFFVGLALIVNGLVVSKRMVEIQQRELKGGKEVEGDAVGPKGLRPADTNEFIPSGFSVTEGTTRHLAAEESKSKEV